MADSSTDNIIPPANSELRCHTWCCCQNLSFWFNCPSCIGCQILGSSLCCSSGNTCRIADDCYACYHNTTNCFQCNFKACKELDRNGQEKGCTRAPWCKSACFNLCCFCLLCKCDNDCGFPRTCCKCASQQCCFDCRCAFPCDDDVPCGCALCGLWLKKPSQMPSGWNGLPDKQTMK
jgi:hypothetical protein